MAEITEHEIRERTRALLAEHDPTTTDRVTFRGAQFDAGLAVVQFPEGKGGLGASRKLQTAVNDELRAAGARWDDLQVNPIGIGMGMPVVLTYGTEEMHERFLRPCFTGEEMWCQLFSEPGAGSDVAGLATRAVRDGDEWVVNGQKVWTTLAHVSRWGMLLCRTDPDQPKHKGMSYFVVDMQNPGVEVRPLYQITGEAEFNEVFFTDARTSVEHVVGGVGRGWEVAMGTLGFERGASTLGQQLSFRRELDDLLALAKANGTADDPVVRQKLAHAYSTLEIMRYNNLRMLTVVDSGGVPGPEMSIGKLYWANWHRDLGELMMLVRGTSALAAGEGALGEEYLLDAMQRTFLYSRSHTIYAGSNEVQRNVLGERVLGLPREPR